MVRQVRGVTDHFVGERFLDLAERQCAQVRPQDRCNAEIGGVPVVGGGLVKTLVLVAQHVVPRAEQLEVPTRGETQRARLEGVFLVADLCLAVGILVEARVVHRHHDKAELDREAVVLVLVLRGCERLVRNDARHDEVAVALDQRRALGRHV